MSGTLSNLNIFLNFILNCRDFYLFFWIMKNEMKLYCPDAWTNGIFYIALFLIQNHGNAMVIITWCLYKWRLFHEYYLLWKKLFFCQMRNNSYNTSTRCTFRNYNVKTVKNFICFLDYEKWNEIMNCHLDAWTNGDYFCICFLSQPKSWK